MSKDKFTTFWGDLNVGSKIVDAGSSEGGPSTKNKPVPATEKIIVNDIDEDEGEEDIEQEEVKVKGISTGQKKAEEAEEEEEEEEEYEYTTDDVSKAYSMLLEEDVLDLPEDAEFIASTEGLADAVAATVQNKLRKEIESIPPVVQQFYAHITGGNAPEDFKPQTVTMWENFDISEEENQEHALRALYTSQGMTEADIEEEIEDLKTTGKLEKKASVAKSTLAKSQETEIAAKAAAQTAATKAAEIQTKKDIDKIKSDIDNMTELAGFELDDKKKAAFKSYLFDARARSGKTQMQENMSDEARRMRIAFLDFIDYNKADMAKEEATKMTKIRRKKLVKFSDKNVVGSNSSTTVTTPKKGKVGDLVLPSIFGPAKIEIED